MAGLLPSQLQQHEQNFNTGVISEQEATRRLETYDFETKAFVSGLSVVSPGAQTGVGSVSFGPAPSDPAAHDFAQMVPPITAAELGVNEEPEPTPFALELIRRQAAEIAKLQAQIDAANGRINEIFARITKYNLGASHKL